MPVADKAGRQSNLLKMKRRVWIVVLIKHLFSTFRK